LPAVGFIAAFALILYLSIKKVSMARVMFIATVIVALTSDLSPETIFSMVKTAFLDKATLELAGAVLAIGLFSTFMREYGFLSKTVSGLTALLGNVKAAIMSVPALIGSMPVLGGAALSAPLVDKLGDPLGLPNDVKAAANLAFRHGTMFVLPFSSNLILTSKLTGFSMGTLISNLWPMSVAIWGIGYLVLLRKERLVPMSEGSSDETAATSTVETAANRGRAWGLGQFLLYGGPLLFALLLGLAFGVPLWLSLVAGTLLAIVLGMREKKPMPDTGMLYKGANFSQVIAMFWIMAFKAFVVESPVFPAVIDKVSAAGVPQALMAILIPLAFGFGSASQTTTLGVLMPLMAPATVPGDARLYLAILTYISSFTAYLFSPLHMCQVLTCEYFKIDIPQVYKRNWPILIGFFAIMGFFYFMATGALSAV
jgi:integral membrane protein (TIGR00529 family)